MPKMEMEDTKKPLELMGPPNTTAIATKSVLRTAVRRDLVVEQNLSNLLVKSKKKQLAQKLYYANHSLHGQKPRLPVHFRIGDQIYSRNTKYTSLIKPNTHRMRNGLVTKKYQQARNVIAPLGGRNGQRLIAQERIDAIRNRVPPNRNNMSVRTRQNGARNFTVQCLNNNFKHSIKKHLNAEIQKNIKTIQSEAATRDENIPNLPIYIKDGGCTQVKLNDRFSAYC